MKKRIGAILLVVAVAVSLGVVPAAQVGATTLTMEVNSDTSTVITKVYNKAGGATSVVDLSGSPLSAVRATEPDPYPTTYFDEGPEATDSTWDNMVSWDFEANAPNADWIWETRRTDGSGGPEKYGIADPKYDADAGKWGRVVQFEKTFDILGVPTSATLHIAADNAYEFWVNTGLPTYSGTITHPGQDGWELSKLKETSVNTSGWDIVGGYNILSDLTPGSNTLYVLAGNEYFDTDDGHSAKGDEANNPAALIFHIVIEYEVPDITKTLTDSDPDLSPDTNSNLIDEADLGTLYTFTMNITVTNSTPATLTSILVQDNFGGELELVSTDVFNDGTLADATWTPGPGKKSSAVDNTGTITVQWTGKTNKVHLWWTIPSLAPTGSATLTLVVATDSNPGRGKNAPYQEYTSPGIYDLNSGASIRWAWIDGFFVEFDGIQTDPIQVEVLPPS